MTVLTLGKEPDPAKRLRKAWGNNIMQLRELRQMSRDELANAVGVSSAAVGQWERGETAPRSHHQIAVADALNCEHSVVFPMRSQ